MIGTLPKPGSFISIVPTYDDWYENLHTASWLPTSEPGSPQYSWTIASGDLPVWGVELSSVKHYAYFACSGYNHDSLTRTVYVRMTKNGGNYAYGSQSVIPSRYYTANCLFYDVDVSDVLGIKLWTTNANTLSRFFECRLVTDTDVYIKGFNTNEVLSHFYFDLTFKELVQEYSMDYLPTSYVTMPGTPISLSFSLASYQDFNQKYMGIPLAEFIRSSHNHSTYKDKITFYTGTSMYVYYLNPIMIAQLDFIRGGSIR